MHVKAPEAVRESDDAPAEVPRERASLSQEVRSSGQPTRRASVWAYDRAREFVHEAGDPLFPGRELSLAGEACPRSDPKAPETAYAAAAVQVISEHLLDRSRDQERIEAPRPFVLSHQQRPQPPDQLSEVEQQVERVIHRVNVPLMYRRSASASG
jgi:hypothetical protein